MTRATSLLLRSEVPDRVLLLGKNHVVFVGNSRTPLTQKLLAGKDSFGRTSARRC